MPKVWPIEIKSNNLPQFQHTLCKGGLWIYVDKLDTAQNISNGTQICLIKLNWEFWENHPGQLVIMRAILISPLLPKSTCKSKSLWDKACTCKAILVTNLKGWNRVYFKFCIDSKFTIWTYDVSSHVILQILQMIFKRINYFPVRTFKVHLALLQFFPLATSAMNLF